MLKNPALRRVLLIIVALAVASFSTFKIKTLMEKNRPVEKVLVAVKDIPKQSVITQNDVGFTLLPLGSKMSGSLQDPQKIVGRRANSTIYKGEQILPQKLGEAPLEVKPGERVVAVPVDAVHGVGMTLKQGNSVDVYFIQKEGAKLSDEKAAVRQAQLVAEGAVVVDVVNKSGASVFSVAPNSNSGNERRSTTDSSSSVVVLKVKDSEARGVATAVENGVIYLVKR